MPAKLQLASTWNRDPLPATEQSSLAYLVVDIVKEESHAASGSGYPPGAQNSLNLSLVLDTSGSMAGAKLHNLKQAVRWVIDHLQPDDKIAVTLFDDEVRPLAPSTRIAGAGGLLGQVEAIREAGGTAMSKGLLVGLDEARKGAGAQVPQGQGGETASGDGASRVSWVSRIIVLTDGQTWGDADRCKELAKEAGQAG